ncbi:hypothetical protein CDD83_9568 [Cordyceps sp. RAO-2017]|nr:hypothetical protein CDD83_9568 [Cordyceps sp. RAO-2017]
MGADKKAGRVPLSVPFLQAQEIQDPLLVDSAWLEVGHVDEFLQFLPAKTPRGWRVMVSDPLAALKLLQGAQADGRGNETHITHGSSNPTIDWFLANSTTVNEECARRIQGAIDLLKRETGITDDEIWGVPVLYKRDFEPRVRSNGDFQVIAAYPNAINGLVLTDSLYVAPKQWGPLDADGTDIMQHAVEMVYEKAGFDVDFVDDWGFHYIKGDIHCVANVFRELPTSIKQSDPTAGEEKLCMDSTESVP